MIYYIHFSNRSIYTSTKDIDKGFKLAKQVQGTLSILDEAETRYITFQDYRPKEKNLAF